MSAVSPRQKVGRYTSKRLSKAEIVEWVFLYRKHLIKIISDFGSPSVLMKRRAVRKKRGPPLAVNRVEQIPWSSKTRKHGPPCWLAMGGSSLPQTAEISPRKQERYDNHRHREKEEEMALNHSLWFSFTVMSWYSLIPEHRLCQKSELFYF